LHVKLGGMPSKEQELLLMSALLEKNSCFEAWQKWKTMADIERLDGGSQKMLPLVLSNLKKNGLKDPVLFERMKSVSIKSWYKNEMIFFALAELVCLFRSAEIKTLVLKGVPIALKYYPTPGLRAMGDFDILVPWEKSKAAGDLLLSNGWEFISKPTYPVFHESYKVSRNGIGFIKNGIECDLHWSVFKHTCYPEANTDFWERAQELEVGREKSLSLSREDQLIHILEHGAYWNMPPPIKWVADAYLLLSNEDGLDWTYFVSKIREKHLGRIVPDMLHYLRTTFFVSIPEETIANLYGIPFDPVAEKLFYLTGKPASELSFSLRGNLRRFLYYRIYLRDYLKKDDSNTLLTFYRFLLFRWELNNPLLLPIVFIRRSSAKLFRYAKRQLRSDRNK